MRGAARWSLKEESSARNVVLHRIEQTTPDRGAGGSRRGRARGIQRGREGTRAVHTGTAEVHHEGPFDTVDVVCYSIPADLPVLSKFILTEGNEEETVEALKRRIEQFEEENELKVEFMKLGYDLRSKKTVVKKYVYKYEVLGRRKMNALLKTKASVSRNNG